MFDRIADRYDLLNRLLSFGTDVRWRRKVAKQLDGLSPLRLLDVATGTADQLLALVKGRKFDFAVGLDVSRGMLGHGVRKVADANLPNPVAMVHGDALALPLADDSINAVTISFGIRNVLDVPKALTEMTRVLQPGGRAVILEFSLPANALIRWGYLIYFRHVLPKIGGLISGDWYAYNYLNKTVETFPYGEDFAELMRAAGFDSVRIIPLTFGIASIYVGEMKS
jgi:demethylmenaquinone methyltransferase/2-methoxy-6-polyprenyl-1,4-benzoquinol methylase